MLIFIKSCRIYSSDRYNIIYCTLARPEIDTVLVADNTKFTTKRRYGWFRVIGDLFFETSKSDQEKISLVQVSQNNAYLYLTQDDNGKVLSCSVKIDNEPISLKSYKEEQLLEDLFSILRKAVYQTLVVSGNNFPVNSYKILKDAYTRYWGDRYLCYLDSVEVLDIDQFFHRYAKKQPLIEDGNDVYRLDNEESVCLRLMENANRLGIPRHALLDWSTVDLMNQFDLQGLRTHQKDTVILQNVFKQSTRIASLYAMSNYLDNKDSQKKYDLCLYLSQDVCLQVMNNSESRVKGAYNILLSELGKVTELEDYVYSNGTSNYFEQLDDIVCLLDIPTKRDLISESTKYEHISLKRYRIELNKAGVLICEVINTSRRIDFKETSWRAETRRKIRLRSKQKEALKALLSNFRRKNLDLVYKILKDSSDGV